MEENKKMFIFLLLMVLKKPDSATYKCKIYGTDYILEWSEKFGRLVTIIWQAHLDVGQVDKATEGGEVVVLQVDTAHVVEQVCWGQVHHTGEKGHSLYTLTLSFTVSSTHLKGD